MRLHLVLGVALVSSINVQAVKAESAGRPGAASDACAEGNARSPQADRKPAALVASVDSLPNQTAAVLTTGGEVFLGFGVDRTGLREARVFEEILSEAGQTGAQARSGTRWRRYAKGLREPLALKTDAGEIYVTAAGQLYRLADANQDGECDVYELVEPGAEHVPAMPLDLQVTATGLQLKFTRDLNTQVAADPENWSVELFPRQDQKATEPAANRRASGTSLKVTSVAIGTD